MTKFLSLLSFLIFLTLTGTTCKNSPTEPEKPTEPDTTSQNFTFETKEFGDGSESSYFNDVWVFSEKNIWAVGYISQNQFQGNCNIMRWNGMEWKFLKTEGISSSSGIYGMWAIDSTEIYFANGSVSRFKKGAYTNMFINGTFSQGQSVQKLWGSSETNIWGVGPRGTVVHYDGTSWKKIDVGYTTSDFWYINGWSADHFWICGYNGDNNLQPVILENRNGVFRTVWDETKNPNTYPAPDAAIYNRKENKYWFLGNGDVGRILEESKKIETVYSPNYFTVGGTWCFSKETDILSIFLNGRIHHYNGERWKLWKDFAGNYWWSGARLTKSFCMIAGRNLQTDKAVIMKGIRQ